MLDSKISEAIKINLDFVNSELVQNIELEYIKLIIENVIEKLKVTADVITDENKDNKDQLKNIWGHFLADAVVAESFRLAYFDAIAKIDSKELKDALGTLANPLTATLVALNDVNTKDDQQVKQIWLDFLKSEPFVNFAVNYLEEFLSMIIKSEVIVAMIMSLIKVFVDKKFKDDVKRSR